ncbi:MAG: hypothetical protein ACRC7W_06390 [Fusobacteriaceae bacterium]
MPTRSILQIRQNENDFFIFGIRIMLDKLKFGFKRREKKLIGKE